MPSREPKITFQNIKVKGSQLKEKVKEIIEEGTARRVIIEKDGRTLLEFPLTVGIGGAAAAILIHAPLTAVGAIAALVTDVHIIVERVEPASAVIQPGDSLPDEDPAEQDPDPA
jgi:hypothetical protein